MVLIPADEPLKVPPLNVGAFTAVEKVPFDAVKLVKLSVPVVRVVNVPLLKKALTPLMLVPEVMFPDVSTVTKSPFEPLKLVLLIVVIVPVVKLAVVPFTLVPAVMFPLASTVAKSPFDPLKLVLLIVVITELVPLI